MINKHLTRRGKKRKLRKILKNVMAYKLQKNYKKYSDKMIDKDEKSMKDNDSEYRNDLTLTGIELEDINKRYFYKNDGYFFDIRELEASNKHPYTNKALTLEDKRQIKRILFFLKSRYYSYRELNEEDYEYTDEEKYTSYKTDVIKKIEEKGVYLPINTFNSYTINEMYYFSVLLLNWRLINIIPNIIYYKRKILYNYRQYCITRFDINSSNSDILTMGLVFKYSILWLLEYIVNIRDNNLLSRCLIIKNTMYPIDIINT